MADQPVPLVYDPALSIWFLTSDAQLDDIQKASRRSADRSGQAQQIARLINPDDYDPTGNPAHFAHHGRLWRVVERVVPEDGPHAPVVER